MTIRKTLTDRSTSLSYIYTGWWAVNFAFFRIVTAETVKYFVNAIGRKVCELDPVPASVLLQMYIGVKIYSFQYLKILLTYLSNLENRTQVIMIDGVKSTQKTSCLKGRYLAYYCMCTTQRQLPILSGAVVSDFISTQMTPNYTLHFVQTTPDQQVSLAWIEHCKRDWHMDVM